jgi:hypothetical protein
MEQILWLAGIAVQPTKRFETAEPLMRAIAIIFFRNLGRDKFHANQQKQPKLVCVPHCQDIEPNLH